VLCISNNSEMVPRLYYDRTYPPLRYDPSMPSPRRDATKKKLVEFERSFGLLMNKLGNFESDMIISMYNTQMQGESVWRASVKHATDRVASLSKQREDLQAELVMLRERGYTVQSVEEEEEEEKCSFGGAQLLKLMNAPASPPKDDKTAGDGRPSTAQTDATGNAEEVDLLQFKPINPTKIELSEKKAYMKSSKLLEAERVLAVLKSGVCALVERLGGVNMISPELRDLLQQGPPCVDIKDDNCCLALQHFCSTLVCLLDSFDEAASPLHGSPSRRSPVERRFSRSYIPGGAAMLPRDGSFYESPRPRRNSLAMSARCVVVVVVVVVVCDHPLFSNSSSFACHIPTPPLNPFPSASA
jgi:hypothetical protein